MKNTWTFIPLIDEYKITAWYSMAFALIGLSVKQRTAANKRTRHKHNISFEDE